MELIPAIDLIDNSCVRLLQGDYAKKTTYSKNPLDVAKGFQDLGFKKLHLVDLDGAKAKSVKHLHILESISKELSIPFTVGGGISSLKDVEVLLRNGADKISVNSSAVKNPNLLDELVKEFGSQCIVLAIDSKLETDNTYKVYVNGGKIQTDKNTKEWINEGVFRGAGEILLTSMGADGTKKGFDLEQLKIMNSNLSIPLIASGGAGNIEDFISLFKGNFSDAGLAASIFHFNEVSIKDLKIKLKENKIEVRI
ncbi:UNVERIFIED_CONTAM: hypothetical protein GTU68_031922 [Idotea baltica]|nr:hypothetical protein [Idotea baltica]